MLARFEREQGLCSRSVTLRPDRFGFAADEILFASGIAPWREEFHRIALLQRALRHFDVIHFNFGQTILQSQTVPRLHLSRPWALRHNGLALFRQRSWMTDLSLLHAANKVIVMTYQGDDARQGDFCRSHFEISHAHHVNYYDAESDEWKRRAIGRVARYADRIYALNPDLLHVLPLGARFLAYANVDPLDWRPSVKPLGDPAVVMHAPTDREAKGTRFLCEAVDELQRKGLRLELALVENLPHDRVRPAYERADIVVDQLLVGWYGGFAVEAMCLGKPVVGYIRKADLGPLSPDFVHDLPIVGATPATIKDVLRDLLTSRRGELPELGRRARRFVEKWHDPRRIVGETVRDYAGLVATKRERRRHSAGSP
jgi:glycosyltransferase involved in cell wall biosynthesis